MALWTAAKRAPPVRRQRSDDQLANRPERDRRSYKSHIAFTRTGTTTRCVIMWGATEYPPTESSIVPVPTRVPPPQSAVVVTAVCGARIIIFSILQAL